jgi:hypothetical protein
MGITDLLPGEFHALRWVFHQGLRLIQGRELPVYDDSWERLHQIWSEVVDQAPEYNGSYESVRKDLKDAFRLACSKGSRDTMYRDVIERFIIRVQEEKIFKR